MSLRLAESLGNSKRFCPPNKKRAPSQVPFLAHWRICFLTFRFPPLAGQLPQTYFQMFRVTACVFPVVVTLATHAFTHRIETGTMTLYSVVSSFDGLP